MLGCDRMVNEIKKYFDIEANFTEVNTPKDLPLYMTNKRRFYIVKILENEFLCIKLGDKDKAGISALGKQLKIFQEKFNLPAALYISNITPQQRSSLIRAKIPFIAPPRQIYLPFLAVVLSNHYGKKSIDSSNIDEYMMPITQSLFLYLLYCKDNLLISKTEAKNFLKCTATSITRASNQLLTMGLIEEFKDGRTIYMKLSGDKKAVFKKAEKNLITPVLSEIYIDSMRLPSDALLAGESALAEKTMLNPSNIKIYAIDKNNPIVKSFTGISPQWNIGAKLVKLQIWKYNPLLLSAGNTVDDLSLVCSLKNNTDERIEMAIEELMERFKW